MHFLVTINLNVFFGFIFIFLICSRKVTPFLNRCDKHLRGIYALCYVFQQIDKSKRNRFCCCLCRRVRDNEELGSDVKSSRPSCPRGQNFVLGLGPEDLSSASDSASSICPRPVLELFILAS